jgi:D-tyrosyl-tRNA(Tyr) deacylase
MRSVVQRVTQASVTIDGRIRAQIERGLVVLLGVGASDDDGDVGWMANKVVGLRIFEDDAGKMNRSLLEVSGALLVVSQFTLYGDVQKGKRPSFMAAMEPVAAERIYRAFCQACRSLGARVEEGVFRAEMQVSLVNDGPVTLIIESPVAASDPSAA